MSYTLEDVSKMVSDDELGTRPERLATSDGRYMPRAVTSSFIPIPISDKFDTKTQKAIHRINGFGSLFYFCSVILRRTKMQTNADRAANLHYQMCKAVEKDGVQDVIEIPRDHFKTTIYSEGFPMWRSLAFTDADEELLRNIGGAYGDDRFILWMRRAHQQDFRWLVASEVIKNAVKIGTRISKHYENNEVFRYIYDDVIPTAGGTWNSESLHHRRSSKGDTHGEGTYDFIGVGGALQSRHYDGIIQDDLVGKEAI